MSAPQAEAQESTRMKNRVGFNIGWSDPFPGLIGGTVAYHLTDFLRGSIGYSSTSTEIFGVSSSISTIAVGAKGFVPGWDLSPTVGLHYAGVIHSGDGTVSVDGFSEDGGHMYASVGIDYQTSAGFNVNGGYQFSFKSGIDSSAYVNLGWFFDFL
jgi:hypothetical protein